MPAVHAGLAFIVASALAAALVAVGARFRGLLRLPVGPRLRLPVDFLLGSWVLAVIVLLLGIAHWWFRGVLIGATVALAALGRWQRTGWRWDVLALPVLGALLALPVALAEPFFYDALVYHLGLPWQALLEGGLRAHPENLFAAFPPLAQLLSAAPLAVGLDRLPAVLHWWSFVAAGAAAGRLARSLGAPPWAAGLAALCLPLLPAQALVAGLPAAEGWAIAGVLAALALALSPRVPSSGALLIGVLVGIASAARLQGIPWSAMVLAVVWLRERRGRALVQGVAGWLAGSAPWWVRNLVLLGDPTAPIFWRREGVATLWRDAGSLPLAEGPTAFARSLVDNLAPHIAYLAPLALAALLALLSRRQGRLWLAAAVATGGVLAWGMTGSLPRFLSPTLGVVMALAAAAAHTRPARWASALALASAGAVGMVFSVVQLGRWGGLSLVSTPGASVRAATVVNDPFPAFAASHLPLDARTLFVGEPRGFGFPRRFVAPSQHDVSPLRAILEAAREPGEAVAALRGQGFTHLLVNQGELSRLAGSYPVAPWRDTAGWRRWNALLAVLGPPEVQIGGVQLFALPSRSGPAV
ncbi:MAG: hypothetical protein A2Y78_12055 [Acidobacteria bacterium RBG_13_68_16]|nr:MAG: hypothetical protein A2Y78_12055 [Acidobacteria bacterium RBG_13_68_16]